MVKHILFIIKKKIKEFRRNSFIPQKGYIKNNIPYFSQFESPELINKIYKKEISAQDDPLWKRSGAQSKREYELWSWNACGMACLKMILAYKLKKEYPIIQLGKRCKELGGYKGEKLDGLFYKPFLKFIKNDFGLTGKIISPMVVSDIISEIENGHIPIVSVSPDIDMPHASPNHQGGHLVVVNGYDFPKKLLFIHDPSGMNKKTQKNSIVSFSHFQNFFAYRGISIW